MAVTRPTGVVFLGRSDIRDRTTDMLERGGSLEDLSPLTADDIERRGPHAIATGSASSRTRVIVSAGPVGARRSFWCAMNRNYNEVDPELCNGTWQTWNGT